MNGVDQGQLGQVNKVDLPDRWIRWPGGLDDQVA